MPDYEAMYYAMVDANEKAIHLLIEAQCKAEEIYIASQDAPQDQEEVDNP